MQQPAPPWQAPGHGPFGSVLPTMLPQPQQQQQWSPPTIPPQPQQQPLPPQGQPQPPQPQPTAPQGSAAAAAPAAAATAPAAAGPLSFGPMAPAPAPAQEAGPQLPAWPFVPGGGRQPEEARFAAGPQHAAASAPLWLQAQQGGAQPSQPAAGPPHAAASAPPWLQAPQGGAPPSQLAAQLGDERAAVVAAVGPGSSHAPRPPWPAQQPAGAPSWGTAPGACGPCGPSLGLDDAMDAGVFLVTEDRVIATEGVDPASPMVGSVAKGALARVVEVAFRPEQMAFRGRLEDPPGWITLLETVTGYRRARRVGQLGPQASGKAAVAVSQAAQQQGLAAMLAPSALPGLGNAEQAPVVIALDVDEVLCRYTDGFRRYLTKHRPDGPLDVQTVFQEAYDAQNKWRHQFALSGGLDRLDAVPGALLALRMLLSAGARLEVVTSRPPVMRESTQALLEGLFGADVFSAMHFIGPGEKGLTCRNIGAAALVDDQLHNVVDATNHGVQCVLFDLKGGYPWGARPEDVPPGVQRMENWSSTCLFLLSVVREASRSAGSRQKVDWMFQYMDARRQAWTAFAGFSG
ncbi:unnamed protein product [Prorocentrum cordatum]|nr:unnamed protein product [Polarella glacialis]